MKGKWALRGLVVVSLALGLFTLFALLLQVPGVAQSIGSAQACATCHNMSPQAESQIRAPHRSLACIDCHAPSGVVEKAVAEVESASAHLIAYFSGPPDAIHATQKTKEIVQANCLNCHGQLVREIEHGGGQYCFQCHRTTHHEALPILR